MCVSRVAIFSDDDCFCLLKRFVREFVAARELDRLPEEGCDDRFAFHRVLGSIANGIVLVASGF